MFIVLGAEDGMIKPLQRTMRFRRGVRKGSKLENLRDNGYLSNIVLAKTRVRNWAHKVLPKTTAAGIITPRGN